MAILINGMKMPDKCMSCTMLVGTFCQVLNIDVDPFYDGGIKRNENCPLIELPEHHGRLIDADAVTNKYGEWYTEEGSEEGFIGTIKDIINLVPTVIK